MATSVVRMEATPAPVEINSHSTVFVVIDMQNDFLAEGGLLHRQGLDLSSIQRVVAPTARAIIAARAAGIPVVYLKMGFRPDLSDLGADESPNQVRHLQAGVGAEVRLSDGTESRVLIRDTWNTDIIRELAPWPEDTVIYHHRFSGFHETTLHDRLWKLGAKHVIVAGCTTSVSVEATIRDAMYHDYSCVLLADCTAEPIGHGLPRSNYQATLLLVERLFGSVSTSEELIKALRRQYSEWITGDLQLR
jgi:ureidoacrylate peracid hydrolase